MTFAERIKSLTALFLEEGFADRDAFARAWVQETGLRPSESVMYEQVFSTPDGFQRRVWFEAKTGEELKQVEGA